MDPHTTTKVCTKCAARLPLDDFYRERRQPDGRRSICRRCHAAYMKAYREANPEKIREGETRWRKSNQEWVNERNRRNQEKRGAEGRDKRNAYLRAYRAANPEKTAAKLRAYAKRYPDKVRARCALRRARMRGAAVCDFTTAQWEVIKAAYHHCCAYCGELKPLTIDHVIPLSKGGNHTASNIVPACRSCNGRKWVKDAPSFQPMLVIPECEL